jgi:hypothetical protein
MVLQNDEEILLFLRLTPSFLLHLLSLFLSLSSTSFETLALSHTHLSSPLFSPSFFSLFSLPPFSLSLFFSPFSLSLSLSLASLPPFSPSFLSLFSLPLLYFLSFSLPFSFLSFTFLHKGICEFCAKQKIFFIYRIK